MQAPRTEEELREWVFDYCGLYLPAHGVCERHCSPMKYLSHAFFDGGDCIVHACRGGGKTQLGAVATLLDMLFKPGIQIRILGGSLEQSEKMYQYLQKLVMKNFADEVVKKPTNRELTFANGSSVELLAQSETSVRGVRIQKLRCDEVEMFSENLWQAAQMTTRSIAADKENPTAIRGGIEAVSTAHVPNGLMESLIRDSAFQNRKVFTWCVLDILQNCKQDCRDCPLQDDCQSAARYADGFMSVEDAIRMKQRTSKLTWQQEMLCKRARSTRAVFDAFDVERDVRSFHWLGDVIRDRGRDWPVRLCAGVDFGFRCFACVVLAIYHPDPNWEKEWKSGPRVWVLDELVRENRTLEQNISEMRAKGVPNLLYCDAAGRNRNSHTGVSDIQLLREAGFHPQFRTVGVRESLHKLMAIASPAYGGCRLTAHPLCRRTVAALRGYQWKDGDDGVDKDGQHDHIVDAIRYGVWGELAMGRGGVREF